jgi:hypothetical protein
MDLETVIIAVVSLLICGLPFWLMIRNRKKNERKLISELAAHSGISQLKLSKYELSANLIIGLDDHGSKLYFLNRTKNGDQFHVLELNNFEDCEIVRVDQVENDLLPKHIQSLAIRFLPKNKQHELIVLQLYHVNETGLLNGELQIVNEWTALLKEKLTKIIL